MFSNKHDLGYVSKDIQGTGYTLQRHDLNVKMLRVDASYNRYVKENISREAEGGGESLPIPCYHLGLEYFDAFETQSVFYFKIVLLTKFKF